MSLNTGILNLGDLMDRIIKAAQAVTTQNATAMADAIDRELQTDQKDPVGDLSVFEVVYLMNGIAEKNIPGTANVKPVDTREMADAIEDDLIERTANALSTKSGKSPEDVKAAVTAGLRSGGAGAFDTEHISVTIPAIVKAAQTQDSSLPSLDDQDDRQIIAAVVDDVRRQTAITLANEMVPPAARIKGGYPLTK